MEGASVEAPHLDAQKGDTSPTRRDEIPRVTTPIDVGALANNFFRVSVGNPQREASESPIPGAGREVSELDVGPRRRLYCLQLDVTMVREPSRPPPPRLAWTVAIIKDMVSTDAPNIKDCVILGPGSAILFFGHHQEPREGLYLHEAQELAEVMTKTTTWMGQPVHQMVFPITIAEGRRAISMSRAVNEHRDLQLPTETLRVIERDAHVTSSGTDEDEYGGARVPSPTVTFVSRRRRTRGRRRVWTPLPQYPGLNQMANPIPYTPQVNFPPPPIMNPIPMGVPPPPYPLPPPPIPAPLVPAPPVAQAVAPVAQVSVAGTTIPTPAPIAAPVLLAAAPVIAACGPPDPSPPPPPGSGPGSVADFDNMSVSGSSTSSASSGRGRAPRPRIPTGGFHLPDLTSLTDTVAYEMWKNTIGFFHLSGRTDELIMPIAYQSIKGDVALDIVTHGPHMNLRDLIARLDNNFGVVSDEDTLMKELYTIKQGTKESVKRFDTRIGYAMMRLAAAFPHAMPTERVEETRKTRFLSGLRPNLKSALAWEMCLDGGGRQMTYEEIKDAARRVEQREDPTTSDDPFVRDNATPTSRDDGQRDRGGQPRHNQTRPQYGGQTRASNQSWPAVRAINLEDPRGDGADEADDGNLGDGADDGGFDPSNYEGADSAPSTTAPLLPPHVKAARIAYHYEQQEQRCYTCDQTGHFSRDCPVRLKALKDKKGLNSKGVPNTGGRKPQKQPDGAAQGTPPTK